MGYKLKRIMMWVPNTTRGLPAEYQEVEYIQSSGTQYIDTGVYGSQADNVEIDFSFPTLPNAVAVPFGSREANNVAASVLRLNASNQIEPYFGAALNTGVTITANGRYKTRTEYKSGSQSVYVDDVLKKTGSLTYTYLDSYTNYLFAFHGTGGVEAPCSCKIYNCKVWLNNNPVRDFVPCYRKLDGEIGLYDLVNDIFYTNAGTGTFTKGNDVPDMVEKEVRPGGGKLPYDNVYIFTDGIFAGTDTSPRTTTIKSATIYSAFYDRRENVIWVYTNSGIGWYDFETNNITIVDSYTRTGVGGAIAFYGEYILAHCDTYVACMDRATKTKLYTKTRPDGSYTGIYICTPYKQDSIYFNMGQGYAQKYAYDITTGNAVGSQEGTNYWQVVVFNDKYLRMCENGNTGIYVSNITSSGVGSATSVGGGSYWAPNGIYVTDTGLIDKVSPTDIEYNAYYVGCVRTQVGYRGINVATKTVFKSDTSSSANIRGPLVKYNDNYAIAFGTGNNSNNNRKLWKIDRSTYAGTQIKTGMNALSEHINITSSGNICSGGNGIMDISGNYVYSNSSFITGFSKTVY